MVSLHSIVLTGKKGFVTSVPGGTRDLALMKKY